MAKAQSSATRLVVAVNTNCGSVGLLLQNDKTIARYSIGKKRQGRGLVCIGGDPLLQFGLVFSLDQFDTLLAQFQSLCQ